MSQKELGKKQVSRRAFLSSFGWGSMGLFTMGLGGASFRFLIPNKSGPSKNSFKVDPPDSFIENVTYINGRRCFIIKDEKGLRALSAVCTHLGCTVNWVPDNDRLECPCHGSIFNEQTGKVLGGPAPRPLEWYRLTLLEDGLMLVDPDDIVGPDKYLK